MSTSTSQSNRRIKGNFGPAKVIDVRQNTRAWLAWRATRVTASAVPYLVGQAGGYKTYRGFFMFGERIWAPDAARASRQLEATILKQYRAKTRGKLTAGVCLERVDNRLFAAYLAALDHTNQHLVEVKAVSQWSEKRERRHHPQLQWQHYVAGTKTGHLVFGRKASPTSTELVGSVHTLAVDRNEQAIEVLIEAATRHLECKAAETPMSQKEFEQFKSRYDLAKAACAATERVELGEVQLQAPPGQYAFAPEDLAQYPEPAVKAILTAASQGWCAPADIVAGGNTRRIWTTDEVAELVQETTFPLFYAGMFSDLAEYLKRAPKALLTRCQQLGLTETVPELGRVVL